MELKMDNLGRMQMSNANLKGANLDGANLKGANLYGANLKGANLVRANIDFSCFPIWCGGTNIKIDDRIACQLIYHLISCFNNENVSVELKNDVNNLVKWANLFHRVESGELPKL